MNNAIKLMILVKNIEGGTGTFLYSLLKIKKLLKKNGLIIKTLVLEKPKYLKVKQHNLIFFRDKDYSTKKYSFSLSQIISFINEFLWVKNNVKDFNPNIIFGIDVHSNLLSEAIKILYCKQAKSVLTTHIDLQQTIKGKSSFIVYLILKWLVVFFYNRADSLVGVSKGVSRQLFKDFNLNKKVVTIYNGQFYKQPAKDPFLINKTKKKIISIARLDDQKDHISLIKAFELALKELPKIELLILSEGSNKIYLKQYVADLSLTKSIFFLGWTKSVLPYIKKSSIFVLSSKREGFSYALLEAMSQGKPVISTNTPYGPSELLGNGKYGILVPMGDVLAMKNAIVDLLSNEKKYQYYAEKALARSKFFSEEKMLRSYKKLISDLAVSDRR